MSERDLEAAEADAIEQDAPVVADEDDDAELGEGEDAGAEVPIEVDPTDLAEQQRVAGLDDDDYRSAD
jgi:hypothetical protein